MVVLLLIASGNVAEPARRARDRARARDCRAFVARRGPRHGSIRQLLVESLLLGVAGGIVGLGLAAWGRDLLLGLFVSGQTAIVTLDTGIDWRVIGFAVGDVVDDGNRVRAASGDSRHARAGLRIAQAAVAVVGLHSRRTLFAGRALVAAQMAFCLLLLIVAGLFVRSLRVLATSEIGFDRQHVLGARLDVRSLGYSARAAAAALPRASSIACRRCPACSPSACRMNGPVMTSSQISGFSIEGYTPRRASACRRTKRSSPRITSRPSG